MAKTIELVSVDASDLKTNPKHGDVPFMEILHASVDLLNDAILITEAEPLKANGPAIIWANAAFYKATGYTENEVVGRTPRLLQGPLSDRDALNRIGAALQKWQPIREEVLNYRKDGTTFWNELEIIPIANEAGWFTHWISIQRDCTIRREFQNQQAATLGNLQRIADNVPGLIFQVHRSVEGTWRFAFISKAVEEILKVRPEVFYGDASNALSVVHPEDLAQLKRTVQESETAMKPWIQEFRTLHPDRSVHWLMGKATPALNPDGSIVWNGFLTDITERHVLEDVVRDYAFHDSLTGLANRRLLSDRLQQAIAQTKRHGWSGALMFLDLDQFKPLNDMYGHAAGDAVLIAVAQRLTGMVREVDTVARLGGDEFVVLLGRNDDGHAQQQATGVVLAEKIRAVLEKPHLLNIDVGGHTRAINYSCKASIGVVVFKDAQVSESELFRRADIAMYAAKSAGGNQVRFFEQK